MKTKLVYHGRNMPPTVQQDLDLDYEYDSRPVNISRKQRKSRHNVSEANRKRK